MLDIRIQGQPAETRALLELLASAGVEVQVSVSKNRTNAVTGTSFVHTYAAIQLGGQPAQPDAGPIRVDAWVEQRALPSGDRRPVRRSRRPR